MSLTVLFTHLKIILLQYFQILAKIIYYYLLCEILLLLFFVERCWPFRDLECIKFISTSVYIIFLHLAQLSYSLLFCDNLVSLLSIQFVIALSLFHLNCLALRYEKQNLDSSSCGIALLVLSCICVEIEQMELDPLT